MNSFLSLFALNSMKNSSISPNDFSEEKIFNILKIPPAQRKFQEVAILKFLTSKVSFFIEQKSNEESIHFQACQAMKYECFNKDATVFNHGDWGRKFYIIISGIVEVLVPNKEGEFIQVNTLNAGKSFGEMALITDSARNATIRCMSVCHFAVLSKDDYLRILGKFEEKKVLEFVNFLKEIPIFKSWSKKNIEEIFNFFNKKHFKRKNIVFSIGQNPDFVYIVESGEFEISKNVVLPDGRTKISLKAAILTKGEVFGDEEVIEGRKREYCCACYSTVGELLAITAKDFLLKIKNDESLLALRRKNKAKSLIRAARDEALNNLYSNSTKVKSISQIPKGKNKVKVRKRYIPEIELKERNGYLELSSRDIMKIQTRAVGIPRHRKVISINSALDLQLRTPSPGLKLEPLRSFYLESVSFTNS